MKKNKNKILFIIKLFLLPTTCCLLTTALIGCATVPAPSAIPAYSINGVTYYPLVSLCDLRGVEMQYDTLISTAYLSKDSKRVNLRAGDALILVNDSIMHLSYPIDIYHGTIVVPKQFKEQVFDILFPQAASAYKPAPKEKIKLRKVVIDAGHGGNDPGAIGKNGLREKDVNLDIARRLRDLLRAEGVQTEFTRSNDKFVPLSTRVNIANKSGADLFISIHSNANRSRSLSGFEVYYVAPTISDSKRAYMTAKSVSLNLKNAVISGSSQDLQAIIWDMIYTNSRAESIGLAHSLCRVMDASIDANILGVKGARFQVLKGVRTPGVLIEVGFVSNLNEEKLLRTGAYRQRLAEGILEGVRKYSQEMALVEVSSR
ncbi:MAG: N-acetylmuramoyl-L-alanine amidase [Candidatus Omnitrophica bacterium]|nr:N-acetylmuramoyl-L-alanine amidase [Candidatus Omnitrophota bacterium]